MNTITQEEKKKHFSLIYLLKLKHILNLLFRTREMLGNIYGIYLIQNLT